MENKNYCINLNCLSTDVVIEYNVRVNDKNVVLVKCNKCKYHLHRYKLENEKINITPLR